MKRCLYGPMDYAKTLKLRFRVGYMGPPERSMRYASSREEEEDAQMLCSLVAKEKRAELT